MVICSLILIGLIIFSLWIYLKRKYLLIRLMEWSLYIYILKHVVPYIRLSLYYPSFTGKQYHQAYKLLKPGDIILTRDNWKLCTFLIPGQMVHAALFVGKRSNLLDYEIAEMIATGFHLCDFFDLCKESDRIIILRCLDWDYNYIKDKVIPICLGYQDTSYDYQFSFGFKSLYCSEMIIAVDPEKRLKADSRDILGLGEKYVCADDIKNAPNVEVIWDSDNCK